MSIQFISIHTPTQGVTKLWRCGAGAGVDFNPHSHAGSDLFPHLFLLPACLFQSTLPRREWHGFFTCCLCLLWFQSTLPRREWLPKWATDRQGKFYFNPHSHAGSDENISGKLDVTNISIHTPTQGVTTITFPSYTLPVLFQSTLPRREWRCSSWPGLI